MDDPDLSPSGRGKNAHGVELSGTSDRGSFSSGLLLPVVIPLAECEIMFRAVAEVAINFGPSRLLSMIGNRGPLSISTVVCPAVTALECGSRSTDA